MKILQINILTHNLDRFFYTKKSLDFLKNIKPENKDKIRVKIFGGESNEVYKNLIVELSDNNIESEYIFIPKNQNNYLNKIINSVNLCETKYSCSMDEDILISNFLWDYLIENINVLDDSENLFLAPLISNGIPSVDLFIEDFLNVEEQKIIKNIFKQTYIDNYWGVDYSSLNMKSDIWNYNLFYNEVRKINHYYKGIHPIRISYEAHHKMAELICENHNKIVSKNNYRIENFKFPYFCNSFFMIKTETWKEIINDHNLYRDIFDEVPLNLYMQAKNLNMCFVRNGFALHMAYNTIGVENQKSIENYFYTNFLNNL